MPLGMCSLPDTLMTGSPRADSVARMPTLSRKPNSDCQDTHLNHKGSEEPYPKGSREHLVTTHSIETIPVATDDERFQLRHFFREKRRSLTTDARHSAAQAFARHVQQQATFASMQRIAFYIAHDAEADPHLILEAAITLGKNVYLPILDNKKPSGQLLFAHYRLHDQLSPNRYGILEPTQPDHVLTPAELDGVLVPLVAFDAKGQRLGMGGGHYDRSFAFLLSEPSPIKPTLIGLAYAFQQIDTLRPEPWDVPLHHIITEEKIYDIVLDHEIRTTGL